MVDRASEFERRAIPWNFTLNVIDGALFAFALSLISRTTVLPIFVQRMGGDNVAVGLIPVFWIAGFNLPQITMVGRAGQMNSKKKLVLFTAIGQRLPWLLLTLLTWFYLDHVSTDTGVALFFLAFGLAAIGGALNYPGWFDLVAEITPVRLRGRLFALRALIGSGLGIVGGWLVEQILESRGFPDGFALLFGLAFTAMMVSYISLVLLKERVVAQSPVRNTYGKFLMSLPMLLRQNRNYRNVLIAEALLVTALAAEAFYAVAAFSRLGLSEGYAGRFTVVMMVASIAGSLLFGFLADRFGHRINLIISAGATLAACAIAAFAQNVVWYYLVFAGSSLTLILDAISRRPIIAEICSEKDRATHVALANMLTSPFVFFSILAGWMADRLGYSSIFLLSAGFAAAALCWLVFMVREPRHMLKNEFDPSVPGSTG